MPQPEPTPSPEAAETPLPEAKPALPHPYLRGWDWGKAEPVILDALLPKEGTPLSLRAAAAAVPVEFRTDGKRRPMTHNTLYAHIRAHMPELAKVLRRRYPSRRLPAPLPTSTNRKKERKKLQRLQNRVEALAHAKSGGRVTAYIAEAAGGR